MGTLFEPAGERGRKKLERGYGPGIDVEALPVIDIERVLSQTFSSQLKGEENEIQLSERPGDGENLCADAGGSRQNPS